MPPGSMRASVTRRRSAAGKSPPTIAAKCALLPPLCLRLGYSVARRDPLRHRQHREARAMSTNTAPRKPESTVATRMSGIREDWLALNREDILEPELSIVDPHHHLWDFPSHRYLLGELLADT